MPTMSILKLKPLLQAVPMQMIIASRRTLSSSRASVITNLNALTHGSSNKNFHPQNAKVLSRRVHANTLSMMGTKELGMMSAENLERRIKHLLSLTTEAKLCIQDCDESTDTDFDEEFESAKMAVDSASIAFSELLEELALTDEGIPLLNEVRKLYAPSVDDLRAELKALIKIKV